MVRPASETNLIFVVRHAPDPSRVHKYLYAPWRSALPPPYEMKIRVPENDGPAPLYEKNIKENLKITFGADAYDTSVLLSILVMKKLFFYLFLGIKQLQALVYFLVQVTSYYWSNHHCFQSLFTRPKYSSFQASSQLAKPSPDYNWPKSVQIGCCFLKFL